MNILNKIFKKKMSNEEIAILTVNEGVKTVSNHLIALARLNFIKPERLVEEAGNIKANAEYLLKMVEAQQKEKGKDENK